MISKKPAAVIFDMDGLLIDTEPIANDAARASVRDLGYALRDDSLDAMLGRNRKDCEAILLGALGTHFPLGEFWAGFDRHYHATLERDGVPLKPGVIELIELLDVCSLPYAVATSTRRPTAIRKLAMAGIGHHFEHIVGGDQVAQSKPHPEIYLKAAALIAIEPCECLALEDSPAGARAALAAGMRTIVIPDLIAFQPEIEELGAHEAESLHAVRAALAALI